MNGVCPKERRFQLAETLPIKVGPNLVEETDVWQMERFVDFVIMIEVKYVGFGKTWLHLK